MRFLSVCSGIEAASVAWGAARFAGGFDAGEDGTGRGTPLVPIAFHPTQDPISSTDSSTHALGCW